ncbi:hypothetical protein HK101_001126 [Irineochytrium annulatum]|nr:hypothetical protein HK101_001126 [Irineochytrium annulatum]
MVKTSNEDLSYPMIFFRKSYIPYRYEMSKFDTRHIQFYHSTPTEDDVFKYFECLFQAADLNVECAVITLIYIERMLVNTGVTLHTSNWARIVLGGLLLAAKVWDDHAVWNIDFCQIFPDVDVSDVNELERWYMAAIQYNVSIKASLYARYYFELRDLAETQIRPWTLKPLTISDANRLEAKTARCQVKVTPETPLNLSKVSIGNSDVSVKDAHGSASGGPESKKLWLDPLSGRSESLAGAVERGMRKSHSDYIFVASAPFASVVMM